jgi:hypothetical protein
MAQSQIISLDEFRQVLLQVFGMAVSQAYVGKPFIGIRLGGGQKIEIVVETERWVEVVDYDFEFDIGDEWRIVKENIEVSRSDLFPFVLGPIRRGPSLNSLLHREILSITIKPNLDLLIKFTDCQEVSITGLSTSKSTGDKYANWHVSTPNTMYRPLPSGLIEVLHRNFSLRPTYRFQ